MLHLTATCHVVAKVGKPVLKCRWHMRQQVVYCGKFIFSQLLLLVETITSLLGFSPTRHERYVLVYIVNDALGPVYVLHCAIYLDKHKQSVPLCQIKMKYKPHPTGTNRHCACWVLEHTYWSQPGPVPGGRFPEIILLTDFLEQASDTNYLANSSREYI